MTRAQGKALAGAVYRASEWRGQLTGNPDSEPLVEFDHAI